MAAKPTTHTATVTPHAASEPGACGGYAMTCTCGDIQTTSLSENTAWSMADKHLEWHAKSGR